MSARIALPIVLCAVSAFAVIAAPAFGQPGRKPPGPKVFTSAPVQMDGMAIIPSTYTSGPLQMDGIAIKPATYNSGTLQMNGVGDLRAPPTKKGKK